MSDKNSVYTFRMQNYDFFFNCASKSTEFFIFLINFLHMILKNLPKETFRGIGMPVLIRIMRLNEGHFLFSLIAASHSSRSKSLTLFVETLDNKKRITCRDVCRLCRFGPVKCPAGPFCTGVQVLLS